MNNYLKTIGLEVHLELKSKNKIFSSSINGFGSSANTLINEIDLGYPGVLPIMNEEVINLGIKAAIILNCKINKKMHFDRKNYFYPDLPKGYQITQSRTPIGYDGYVEIEKDGEVKRIEISDIHLEEDTAKSTHRQNESLLDFNRAGVPLLEIVTKACIDDPIDAKLYLEKLKELMLYADISDCKMEEGSMRCDANISVRKKEQDKLNEKIEIKNIGSISNVLLALEQCAKEQVEMYEKNESIRAQTRRFDDKLNKTVLMRYKETVNDYRYFPEPDIPYVYLDDERIESIKKDIPLLPDELRKIYHEKGLNDISSNKLINNLSLSKFFNSFLDEEIDLVTASNLLLGDISSYLNILEITIDDTKLTKDKFISLVNKVSDNSLTSRNVKDILEDVLEKELSLDEIIKEKGIANITDSNELNDLVDQVISANEASVTDYLNGHDRALKYLMGQIMKASHGKANPAMVNKILIEKLQLKKKNN